MCVVVWNVRTTASHLDFTLNIVLGGEDQRSKLFLIWASSAKAHCTGKPSYLEPNSGSLHVPVEGVYRVAEKIEDRSRIGEKQRQNNAEKPR